MTAPRSASDCARRIAEVYGTGIAVDGGVVHVAAVWRDPRGRACVLRSAAGAPACATDRFALHLARARADVIVTTGRILRDEPALTHAVGDTAAAAAAWRDWRARAVQRLAVPRSIVLTSGRALDFGHPLFAAGSPVSVFTEDSAARTLAAAAAAAAVDVEIIGHPAPSLRALLAHLRQTGCRTVVVEAGPTTARALYVAPTAVDELMLSVFEAPELALAWCGPVLFGTTAVPGLRPAGAMHRIPAPDGVWSFQRWRRRQADGSE